MEGYQIYPHTIYVDFSSDLRKINIQLIEKKIEFFFF